MAAHPGRRQVGPHTRHVLRLARQQADGVVFGNLLLHKILRQVGQQHPERRYPGTDDEDDLGVHSDRTRRVLRVCFGLQVSPYEETETDQTPLGPLHGGLDEITKLTMNYGTIITAHSKTTKLASIISKNCIRDHLPVAA